MKIINVISIGSVKFLPQNCLNTLIDLCIEWEFQIFNVMSIWFVNDFISIFYVKQKMIKK